MTVYLFKKEDNTQLEKIENVLAYGKDFVLYTLSGNLAKKYCDEETEYFGEHQETSFSYESFN